MNIPDGLTERVVGADYLLVEVVVADGMFAGTATLHSGEVELQARSRGLHSFPARPAEQSATGTVM